MLNSASGSAARARRKGRAAFVAGQPTGKERVSGVKRQLPFLEASNRQCELACYLSGLRVCNAPRLLKDDAVSTFGVQLQIPRPALGSSRLLVQQPTYSAFCR